MSFGRAYLAHLLPLAKCGRVKRDAQRAGATCFTLGSMSDESQRMKATINYPVDVSKAVQLLAQKKIVDPDAVVTAFGEIREDESKRELARVVAWLRARPIPTPATWDSMLQALEGHAHRG